MQCKVLRWALRLSIYRYPCYHIKGEENFWADLMSLWYSKAPTVRRILRVSELPSSSDADFKWPSQSTLIKVQQDHAASRPADLILNDHLRT